jgi:hypothetical protein
MGVRTAVIFAATALLLVPHSAAAQNFEFVPHLGMHMPVGLLLEGKDLTDNESLARRRQLGATSIGARVAFRTSGRFTIETSATYSPSLVAITDHERTQDLGSRVLMSNAKVLYHVAGERGRGRWSFHAGPGVGIVHRYGEGWTGASGTTDMAIVLAGRGRLATVDSNKAFLFTVEDYVTRAAFRGTNADADPRIHHDVIYSLGFSIPLTRR